MRAELGEHILLRGQRIDVAPALLEPDACAHKDQSQVVVEDVRTQRLDDDIPGRKRNRDQQDPPESYSAEIAPGPPVETAKDQTRSARVSCLRDGETRP